MENLDIIIENGGIICYNSLASRISGFKSGGKIKLLIQPTNYECLVKSLELAPKPYIVLGACTNTLISDKGYNGTVISTRKVNGWEIDGDGIISNCGESLINLANIAKNHSLSGLEELSGIPASIGGAVVMNSGAYGRYMQDVVEYADCFVDGKVERLFNEQLGFAYRDSIFNHCDYTVLRVKFKLVKKSKTVINETMQEVARKRKKSNPTQPSLGCVFMKYDGISAGQIIEDLGLKNLTVGGAQVSDVHANFIINTGKATSSDYYELMRLIEDKVSAEYGIKLTREVRLIGDEFI